MVLSFALVSLANLATRSSAWKAQFQVGPISVVRSIFNGSSYVIIEGGRPSSRLVVGRKPVASFVKESGAAAGINGTFFVMASMRSRNNLMVGPVMTEQSGFVACSEGTDSDKLASRPFVVWNHDKIAIADYRPGEMNRSEGLTPIMSDATDCFVAGSWLVRDGQVMSGHQILEHGPRDAQNARRRVFIGMTSAGKFVAGASLGSVTSSRLALAAKQAGCQQAALMDSGFSTSLVVGAKTLASGHSRGRHASRPVPHAILLFGQLDKAEAN